MFKKLPFEQNNLTTLTEEQIAFAKQQYGDCFQLTVEDKVCFIHKPTRQIIDLAHASSAKRTSMFEETILRNCWLAGDKDMVENDDYFYAVGNQLNEIIKFKSAELKKL